MDSTDKAFSKSLRNILGSKAFSVPKMAKEMGVSPQTIYGIARGDYGPSLSIANKIAKYIGVSLDTMLDQNLLEHDLNECIRRVTVAAKKGERG